MSDPVHLKVAFLDAAPSDKLEVVHKFVNFKLGSTQPSDNVYSKTFNMNGIPIHLDVKLINNPEAELAFASCVGFAIFYDVASPSSFEGAKDLMPVIKRFNAQAPVVVVAGRCHNPEAVTIEQGKRLADSFGAYFLKVSAETDNNIQALFDLVVSSAFLYKGVFELKLNGMKQLLVACCGVTPRAPAKAVVECFKRVKGHPNNNIFKISTNFLNSAECSFWSIDELCSQHIKAHVLLVCFSLIEPASLKAAEDLCLALQKDSVHNVVLVGTDLHLRNLLTMDTAVKQTDGAPPKRATLKKIQIDKSMFQTGGAITELSNQTLKKIFEYVPAEEILGNVYQVCKKFLAIAKDRTFWSHMGFDPNPVATKQGLDIKKRVKALLYLEMDITSHKVHHFNKNMYKAIKNGAPK